MDTGLNLCVGAGSGVVDGDPAVSGDPGMAGPADAGEVRLEDLAQIIGAYNDVTSNLRNSYESLKSQVVRLQGELASTNARLQRSKRLAALGEMAAGIAHEIRNPLAAIQLYADVLAKDLRAAGDSGGAASGTANKIVSAVRGLNAIVNDVLSFSREISPETRAVDVCGLFDDALDACRPEILAGGVDVKRLDRVGSGSVDGLVVEADSGLLQQALVNLIRNAVDAVRERGRRVAPEPWRGTLTLDAVREGERVNLVVQDSGCGIADCDIDRIFNPFFTTRNSGTGLGLAIVHRIIDAHGGTIGVHNDGGAVFTLNLPCAVDAWGVGRVGVGGGVSESAVGMCV